MWPYTTRKNMRDAGEELERSRRQMRWIGRKREVGVAVVRACVMSRAGCFKICQGQNCCGAEREKVCVFRT